MAQIKRQKRGGWRCVNRPWHLQILAPGAWHGSGETVRCVEEAHIDFTRLVRLPSVPPGRLLRFVYDIAESLRGAVIIIFVVFAFALKPVGVNGHSMMPTLRHRDWLLVNSFDSRPRRGDIVVITQPNRTQEPLVKRVIALGGQTVDINFETHEVFVDGELQMEPYIAEPTARASDVRFPLLVKEGYVFVMGDNRNDSLDSRSSDVGLIDERYIYGRALWRFFPFGQWRID
jgi:signal peptidase I